MYSAVYFRSYCNNLVSGTSFSPLVFACAAIPVNAYCDGPASNNVLTSQDAKRKIKQTGLFLLSLCNNKDVVTGDGTVAAG